MFKKKINTTSDKNTKSEQNKEVPTHRNEKCFVPQFREKDQQEGLQNQDIAR